MRQEIQWIPLDKINPLFEARVSNAFITEAKYHLYYQAGLNIGDPKRLTGQVINVIKQLNKADNRVQLLTSAQQIKTFDQALNPKRSILNKLKDTVSRFMPYGKTS